MSVELAGNRMEKLYKEMYSALYAYAVCILKDSALGEEAVQGAFRSACAEGEQFLSSENLQGRMMLTLKRVMRDMLSSQEKPDGAALSKPI